jgi:MFS family permease
MSRAMVPATTPVSYRALLAVPSLGRALLGMQVARVAQAMTGVAMVLFVLTTYRSPALAGVVTMVGILPGLVVSPVAGALLDRHGRTRLIVADLIIAMSSLVLIGLLALAGRLPIWLLLVIAGLSSLTGPLSATGLRTLFPLMVPRRLWERVNAIDANGYVVAAIIGPPLAAGGVTVLGGPASIILIGLTYGVGAVILVSVPEPAHATASTGRVLRDARDGLLYTWRNPTLRALGFSISTVNIAGGMVAIVVPLLVLERFHLGEATVGFVFAIQGVVGMVVGLLAGRIDTRGRERRMIAVPMLLMTPVYLCFLPVAGFTVMVAAMALLGILNGPMDVAMFTMRQRRTDPAWMGRAFAVSMSFNFAGWPIGSAIAGWLASSSIEAAVLLGVAASLAAAVISFRMIPAHDPVGDAGGSTAVLEPAT